jgi:hypothetical protein
MPMIPVGLSFGFAGGGGGRGGGGEVGLVPDGILVGRFVPEGCLIEPNVGIAGL